MECDRSDYIQSQKDNFKIFDKTHVASSTLKIVKVYFNIESLFEVNNI